MGNLLIKLERREIRAGAQRWERSSVPSGASQDWLRRAGRRRPGIREDQPCDRSVILLQTTAQKVKVKLNLWQIGSWETSPSQRRIGRNLRPGGSE